MSPPRSCEAAQRIRLRAKVSFLFKVVYIQSAALMALYSNSYEEEERFFAEFLSNENLPPPVNPPCFKLRESNFVKSIDCSGSPESYESIATSMCASQPFRESSAKLGLAVWSITTHRAIVCSMFISCLCFHLIDVDRH